MLAFAQLLEQCASQVSPALMYALVRKESAWEPFAIGMDEGHGAVKQPSSLPEAVAIAKELVAAGRKFSVGLAQIHLSNVARYGMTWEQAFDACENLAVGQNILWSFFSGASASGYAGVAAIRAALRGYNSGSVAREANNDYAHRVFEYMRDVPAELHFGKGVSTSRQPAEGPLNPLTVTTLTPVELKAPRAGESLDIFEKTKPAGF